MSRHSLRCQIILCKQTTFHRHSATVSLESSPLVTAHGVVDNEEARGYNLLAKWNNFIGPAGENNIKKSSSRRHESRRSLNYFTLLYCNCLNSSPPRMIISLPENFSGKNALHLNILRKISISEICHKNRELFSQEREFFVAGNEEEFCWKECSVANFMNRIATSEFKVRGRIFVTTMRIIITKTLIK